MLFSVYYNLPITLQYERNLPYNRIDDISRFWVSSVYFNKCGIYLLVTERILISNRTFAIFDFYSAAFFN